MFHARSYQETFEHNLYNQMIFESGLTGQSVTDRRLNQKFHLNGSARNLMHFAVEISRHNFHHIKYAVVEG